MRNDTSTELFNYESAHILVVDDDHSSARLLELSLHDANYINITATQDPTHVLKLYEAQRYDLILLDLNMPVMDGFAVMQQLNEHYPDDLPPILVLSGEHEQQIRVRALQHNARDFLTKPFHREELLARVKNLLEVRFHNEMMRHNNMQLENVVHMRTQELETTRLEIIRCLGHAAEYRDNETGMHIIRMSKISELIAKTIGLSDEQCSLILHASPMHDIGKIGVPDSILLKPGKLTNDEWITMKKHTTIGADILSGSDSDLMNIASLIALTHHEQWDGSGYPHALQGEDIPLLGRIVALADVFDALTSERPYKKAWSVEAALEYIEEQSGKHFDPLMVEAFKNVIPQTIEISAQHSDSVNPSDENLDDNDNIANAM